jgi:hypothetical protein
MPTTPTVLFPPPLRAKAEDGFELLSQPYQKWLLTVQNLLQLRVVDTTAGSYAETPPAAGLNAATGQSNQNSEIVYVKSSSDGNTFTLNGVQGSPYTITAQFGFLRIKSDGAVWWRVG